MFVTDNSPLIILVALVIDAISGDPAWLYKRIPHPVALVGNVIEKLDGRFNRGTNRLGSFFGGLGLAIFLIAVVVAIGILLEEWLSIYRYGWIFEALLASTLIAFRGLYDGVVKVAQALETGTEQARSAVAHLVGRDCQVLDQAGIARAAIESTAENFSDGVVAPVFWFVLFGLPGIFAYKTVNTLDSMLGHRDARYEYFGKAAARIDDAVNWLPARLSAFLFIAAAFFTPRASARRAWRCAWRDARLHRSINAGWPEAAVAGAMGFSLAGPRRYQGEIVDDAWMGDGRAGLSAYDVHATLRLYITAGGLLGLVLAVAAMVGL